MKCKMFSICIYIEKYITGKLSVRGNMINIGHGKINLLLKLYRTTPNLFYTKVQYSFFMFYLQILFEYINIYSSENGVE